MEHVMEDMAIISKYMDIATTTKRENCSLKFELFEKDEKIKRYEIQVSNSISGKFLEKFGITYSIFKYFFFNVKQN